MIRINVFVQAEGDKFAQAVAVARLLAEASQKEKGCVAYDVFTSVTRPDVFMICETWTDEAALSAHAETPHYTAHVPELKALAAMKMEKFFF